METQPQPKRGRGRPQGAVSCVRVKLADLNRYFREDAVISVSKKFLEEIGLTVQEAHATIVAEPEQNKEAFVPEFTLTTWDDEE